eukprot:6457731-Amphidinium_carterae.1
MAKWLRREVLGKFAHRLADSAYESLEQTVYEELEQEHLVGPLSEEEGLRVLGDIAAFARRFVLRKQRWIRWTTCREGKVLC